MTRLHLISAGAAKGIVEALSARFRDASGTSIAGTFGAVGAMRDLLLADHPCDAVILTRALLDSLAASGHVHGATIRPLGRVQTGVAIRAGDELVSVRDEQDLRATLRAATSVYIPDPQRSTAGVHFMDVVQRLGLRAAVSPRLVEFASGAQAMAALARAADARPIGCTQVTEILYTPGVLLVASLPEGFDLATTYAAAVSVRAAQRALAEAFVALVTGPASESLRRSAGFQS